MRNTLLKRAVPWAVLATVVATLVWSIMPARERAPSDQEAAASELPPTAASSAAASQSAPAPEPSPTPVPLNAEQLTERAKRQLALQPAAALADIAEADKLAGTAADAQNEMRRVLEIHALVRLGRVGLARTLTDRFYRTFPNSDRAAELERLTGYHPRPARPSAP